MGQHADDYDPSDRDYTYYYYHGGKIYRPTCSMCGKSLTWHHTGVRWALIDRAGHLHYCRPTEASVDEFANVSDPAQGLG